MAGVVHGRRPGSAACAAAAHALQLLEYVLCSAQLVLRGARGSGKGSGKGSGDQACNVERKITLSSDVGHRATVKAEQHIVARLRLS